MLSPSKGGQNQHSFRWFLLQRNRVKSWTQLDPQILGFLVNYTSCMYICAKSDLKNTQCHESNNFEVRHIIWSSWVRETSSLSIRRGKIEELFGYRPFWHTLCYSRRTWNMTKNNVNKWLTVVLDWHSETLFLFHLLLFSLSTCSSVVISCERKAFMFALKACLYTSYPFSRSVQAKSNKDKGCKHGKSFHLASFKSFFNEMKHTSWNPYQYLLYSTINS